MVTRTKLVEIIDDLLSGEILEGQYGNKNLRWVENERLLLNEV